MDTSYKFFLRGVNAHSDKLTRFQPMLARYEQGLVYHTAGLPPEFEKELLAFPLGDYKDMVDALGLAFTCCPDPSGRPRMASAGSLIDFEFGGFDEFELEGIGLGFDE